MKFYVLTLGIAGSVIALGLTAIALAAPADAAEPLTIAHSWSIEHQNLVREFSQGLGADLPGAPAATADAAEPLTAAHSWSIEHQNLVREFSQGLGADLSGRDIVASADAEPATAGTSAETRELDRDRHQDARAHDHGAKHVRAKLSRQR